MRKVCSILGSAVALAAAASAQAGVTLVVVPITLTNATLATNWQGYELKLVADAGQTVAGFDFYNGGGGIFGNIHQRWTIGTDPDTGDPLPATQTPTGTFPAATATTSAGSDSFFGFNSSLLLSNPNPLTEDSDLANGSNPPFTRSPIADTAAFDFGVGTSLTGSGVIAAANQTQTLNLAFIIIPKSSSPNAAGTATVFGVATDSQGGATVITQTVGATATPEPASLGVLAIGGLALMARRRKA